MNIMAFTLVLLALVGSAICEEVCYPRLGCFNDDPPWDHLPLPEGPDVFQTEFRLYTRSFKGNRDYELISTENPGNFDARRKTFIYVHGFRDSANGMATRVRDAMLEKDDYNVIMVDWERGADFLLYFQSASNSRIIGAEGALLLTEYHKRLGLNLSDVYMSGMSLGAQAASQIAKRLNTTQTGKIGRITGLDPAGPFLDLEDENEKSPKLRLYAGDAEYVDVIHTNVFDWLNFGIGIPSGHADFYPNGAGPQPGCGSDNNCSHVRAFGFFAESIRSNCTFRAAPCNTRDDAKAGRCNTCDPSRDCQYMGWRANLNKERTGTFYLTTNENSPYCKI